MPSASQLHGALPPTDEQRRELYDIGRDIRAVAAKEKGAVDELARDLAGVTTESTPATQLADTLARAVDRAMTGCRTDDELFSRLAVALYAAVSRGEVKGADRTALSDDVRRLLGGAGCGPAGVTAMAQAVR